MDTQHPSTPEFWGAPILQPGMGRPWVAKAGFVPLVRDEQGRLRLADDPIGHERAIHVMSTVAHFTVETKYPGRKKSFDLGHIIDTRTKYLSKFMDRVCRNTKSPTPGSPAKAEKLDAETRLVWGLMVDEMARNSLPWFTQKGFHRPLSLGVIDHATFEALRDSVPDPSRTMMDFMRDRFEGKPLDADTFVEFNTLVPSLLHATRADQEDWLGDQRVRGLLSRHAFQKDRPELLDEHLIESELRRWMDTRRVLRAMQAQDVAFTPLSDNDLGMNASDVIPDPEDTSGQYRARAPRGALPAM